jgi:phosphopantetheinyl transferase (holo-ACP synthase)
MGTDIVAVAWIAALMEKSGMVFLERWFTAREIADPDGRTASGS